MSVRSLRFRVLLGAALWSAGLLAASHIITGAVLFRAPRLILIAHNALLLTTAIVCLIIGLAQVRRGLASFHQLREALAAVRRGGESRVTGAYPAEVQPVVDEVNAFLEHRERTVSRAIGKAGDLAHGLKTPLAVLAHEAAGAAAAGHGEVAAAIERQVERMRRQVDYHLAHARAAASGATTGTRSEISESAEGLARTLRRLHAERGVEIHLAAAAGNAVRVQREDLDEMLGNLLDNACQWARSRVVLSSRLDGGEIEIVLEDDGPGIAEHLRSDVLQRGVRADEALPGSGLGLAIVRDLVELYGGTIALGATTAGGLRVTLRVPAV